MDSDNSRRRRPLAAADVLQKLFSNGKSLSSQFKRWKLWRRWREVVGDTIADHSLPVGYNAKGTLFIWVENSVWLNQFHYMKPHIMENVNKEMGDNWAKRIHFTTDRKSIPSENESSESMRNFIKNSE